MNETIQYSKESKTHLNKFKVAITRPQQQNHNNNPTANFDSIYYILTFIKRDVFLRNIIRTRPCTP